MSSTPPRFPFAVTGAAVLLAGFALGWYGRPAAVAPERSAAATPTATPAAATPVPAADAAQAFDTVLAAPASAYQQRLRLAQAAAPLDRAQLIAALERERARHPETWNASTLLPTEALLARFAAIDPAAAMLWLAQSYPPEKIADEWLSVTLGTWVARDQPAAVAWAHGLPSGPLRRDVATELCKDLALTDPALAMQQCAKFGSDYYYGMFEAVYALAAGKDLRAACAQALALPPSLAPSAVDGIMKTWAAQDPAGAYAWTVRLPPGNLHDKAVEYLYRTWGERDPAAAGAWLVGHGGAALPGNASDLAEAWAKHDLAAARAWSEQLPGPARQSALRQVLRIWSEADPRGAMQYALTMPEKERRDALNSAVANWADANRTEALAWVEQQPAGKTRGEALSVVAREWADTDPRACAEYLVRHAETGDALSDALDKWTENDPRAVWQWGQGLTDPDARAAAQKRALYKLADRDPAATAALFAQLAPAAQADAAGVVAANWMYADPPAAVQWAVGLPEGDVRKDAWRAIVKQWGDYDAPAAAGWLTGQTSGPARDKGITALLEDHFGDLAPASAVTLAQALQDPEVRSMTTVRLAEDWIKRDRAAATAWIGQSQDLTDDERADLLKSAAAKADSP